MDKRRFDATESMNTGAAHASVNPPRFFQAYRRTRRFAATRIVSGHLVWVVPAVLAAGWELVYRNRVVLVLETRIVEHDGRKSEAAIVEDSSGHRFVVEITREDNAGNRQVLEGSIVEEQMP